MTDARNRQGNADRGGAVGGSIRIGYAPPVRTVLVTGGAGFIGSAVCRLLASDGATRVVNLDSLASAAAPGALDAIADQPNYRFVHGDIGDRALVSAILAEERVTSVMHLASERRVDRPVGGPVAFIDTNITGTFHLLEASLEHWRTLLPDAREAFRFHHVSTDEVFGPLPFDGSRFDETAAYRPSTPLSASKAAADHLVRAWHSCFGLPVVLSASSNSYGPWQCSAELIPSTILNAIAGRAITVYGTGANVRDWLHVDDHALALQAVSMRGEPGETYLIGSRAEHNVIAVVTKICDLIDRIDPRPDGRKRRSLIGFAADRRAQDRRRAIDPGHLEGALGWQANIGFDEGLLATIDWYRDQARVERRRLVEAG